MSFIDWLIVIIPTLCVFGFGLYSKRYVRSVADFLSAGRVAGRYVMCAGDVATGLAVVLIVSFIEIHYKTGFALVFWNNILLPLGVIVSLYGYCNYRFRETKAMSLGQFLEMRYNRSFRIFAAGLRSLSEMLANMIMPAVAARFFIYYFDLPHHINLLGFEIPVFTIIVIICLTMAISIICFGGTLALLVTDALQGLIFYPLLTIFVIFILWKFNWGTEIVPVMMDRVQGESFLNPYDIAHLRDFNLFMIFMSVLTIILHRASWLGAGTSTAAKSPHEQKMAGLLGTWKGALSAIFYVLIAICIIVVMNHKNFATDSQKIKNDLNRHIAQELVAKEQRGDFVDRIKKVSYHEHNIGVDKPLSQDFNVDTIVLTEAHNALKDYNGESEGNAKFQQYRTLYHQLMSPIAMRHLLPPILTGLFALLMVLAMISTDDTRIFSASLTFTQDVVMPLCKKQLTPKQHITVLRLVSIGVGVFFFIGSSFMSQLEYISLFIVLMSSIWMGGCGPLMIFGLYSKFGNAAGAFTSIIASIILTVGGILIQRNWANVVYPFLYEIKMVEPLGNFLSTVSSPFNPYIIWEMNPVKFPINAYEIYFLTMVITFILFLAVTYFTQKEPFNLDRMLHRGIYNIDGENKNQSTWTLKNLYSKLIGITSEYTKGDKIIAWGVFFYSIVYNFFIIFIGVIIWNAFTPWTIEWWGKYFLITVLIVPGIVAFISVFWFGIGGIIDLYRLFRDLNARTVDALDNGSVEGNVSLSDKIKFEKIEEKQNN